MKPTSWLFLALPIALAGTGSALAQMQHQHAAPASACAGTGLACAAVATPAFAPDGSLWLSWAAGGQVMAAHSTDLGHSFAPAVAVVPAPVRLDNGPDARPKIVAGKDGQLAVTYAVFQDDRYNGRGYISRSADNGASFAAPVPITDDKTSQRFETAAIDPSGDLFVAWLDKRDAALARNAGKKYEGAALAYAWAQGPRGELSPAKIAEDQTCECCRIGVAFAGPHRPIVVFRNVFDGTTRDHAIVTFADANTPGPLYRVSDDEWKTNVCPHQGPALAVSGDTYHIAYFTNGQVRQGVFYVRSQDGGAHFSTPMPLGAGHRAERPTVYAQGQQVWLAWKEFDGESVSVAMIHSSDGGASWSKPQSLATTGGASDHPLLVGDGNRVFLSWLTRAEGYRLLPLPGVS
jgi:hypothetical protein